MADRQTYHELTDIRNTLRLREVLATLPPFVKDFFRAIDATTSAKTRISYAYDIRIFFQFLQSQNPVYRDLPLTSFKVDDLDRVKAQDIEEYLEYLKLYQPPEETSENGEKGASRPNTNGERGLKRKISSLRSFYAYYFRHEMIKTNPTVLIDMPKVHERTIVRLEPDEVAELLDLVENCGAHLSGQALNYYNKTKERDLALVTLLLGTGIRVSECVGLDIEDIDFKNNGIRIIRKGGNEAVVYFGEEVGKALRSYIEVRKNIHPAPGNEHALFYSAQRKRMNVRSVENLVEKYASQVTTTKKITPHKLRSTYGTALYRETGDIYLVADVLGHKDVNTTRRHYAAMDDDRRRKAAGAVKLREQ
ncbi:MAG: tyrosine-type recombinase/integrase [Lachnospiraceae bacterium]|jgi:integrase/recombinase XerC|nr:tyrosine-type recombinase/integrase [Lachnospiraceae bacterium]